MSIARKSGRLVAALFGIDRWSSIGLRRRIMRRLRIAAPSSARAMGRARRIRWMANRCVGFHRSFRSRVNWVAPMGAANGIERFVPRGLFLARCLGPLCLVSLGPIRRLAGRLCQGAFRIARLVGHLCQLETTIGSATPTLTVLPSSTRAAPTLAPLLSPLIALSRSRRA